METKIRKGELITLAQGEYSCYRVAGVYRALIDFDPQEQIAAFIAQLPAEDRDDDSYHDLDDFITWVARCGCLEPVESREWHIGSYGSFASDVS